MIDFPIFICYIHCLAKKNDQAMNWMTRLSHQWIFSSLMARAYSRTTMPRFIGLHFWKSGAWGHMSQGAEESFSLMNWPPQSPDFTPLKVFGVCWKTLNEWFDSPAINTKSWPKMTATLDGNKCCDIAKGCRNSNQSKRRSNEILGCATFFWTGSVYAEVRNPNYLCYWIGRQFGHGQSKNWHTFQSKIWILHSGQRECERTECGWLCWSLLDKLSEKDCHYIGPGCTPVAKSQMAGPVPDSQQRYSKLPPPSGRTLLCRATIL